MVLCLFFKFYFKINCFSDLLWTVSVNVARTSIENDWLPVRNINYKITNELFLGTGQADQQVTDFTGLPKLFLFK